MGFIPYIDSYFFDQPADRVYHIDIYIDRSVLVLYINDQVCYTNRVYGIRNKPWTIRCYDGSVQVTDIRQQIHNPNKTTALEQVSNSVPSQVCKYLENDQIVIYRGQDKYTISGKRL